MNDTNPSTDYLNRCIKWRDEKIAELEKAVEELNHQLKIAVSKYIDADQE